MAGLNGDFRSMPLSGVLQLIEGHRRTGVLKIEFPKTGRFSGSVHFVGGQIVDADAGPLRGEDAVYELFDADSGVFAFDQTAPWPKRGMTPTAPLALLMESARIVDTKRTYRQIVPELRTVPYPNALNAVMMQASEEEASLLRKCDGFHDFRELMEKIGVGEFDMLRLASTMVSRKWIELLEPRTSVLIAVAKEGFLRKKTHAEVAITLKQKWSRLAPYEQGVVGIKLLYSGGPTVVPVNFVDGIPEDVVSLPKSVLQQSGLNAGDVIGMRPAN